MRSFARSVARASWGCPSAASIGGGALCFADYLQVLEQLSNAWGSVGLGVSVHTLACLPLSNYGNDEQRSRWLNDDLAGERLGAYCLSESDAGSDAAALKATAERSGDDYVVNGTKAWISHGGEADFYVVMARTQDTGAKGITCFLVEAEYRWCRSSACRTQARIHRVDDRAGVVRRRQSRSQSAHR